jgi:hypothetical protein
MEITGLVEHASGPWEALPGHMQQTTEKEWRLRDRPWRLPHSYTLQAVKPEQRSELSDPRHLDVGR